MDTCAITALDAITAFAVPNPSAPRSAASFQVWSSSGSPRRNDHSAYFGLALRQPFSTVDLKTIMRYRINFQLTRQP